MSELVEFLQKWLDEDEEFWKRELDDLVMGGIAERMLATVAAHRLIVEAHPRCDVHDTPGDECDACITCGDGSIWPCPTLLALASVYADRPGYREEWRP